MTTQIRGLRRLARLHGEAPDERMPVPPNQRGEVVTATVAPLVSSGFDPPADPGDRFATRYR